MFARVHRVLDLDMSCLVLDIGYCFCWVFVLCGSQRVGHWPHWVGCCIFWYFLGLVLLFPNIKPYVLCNPIHQCFVHAPVVTNMHSHTREPTCFCACNEIWHNTPRAIVPAFGCQFGHFAGKEQTRCDDANAYGCFACTKIGQPRRQCVICNAIRGCRCQQW